MSLTDAQTWLELYATLSAGLFAGSAVSISLVEHPARLESGAAAAVAQFQPSYRRASAFQGTLLMSGAPCGVAAWLLGSGGWWAAGAAALLGLIPYTLILIRPINKRLLSPAAGDDPEAAWRLLTRWGRLHALRSLLSLLSFLIFLLALWGRPR